MWLAHHFPGLSLSVEGVDALTPEQGRALWDVGNDVLLDNEKVKLTHTKVIAQAAGMRLF